MLLLFSKQITIMTEDPKQGMFCCLYSLLYLENSGTVSYQMTYYKQNRIGGSFKSVCESGKTWIKITIRWLQFSARKEHCECGCPLVGCNFLSRNTVNLGFQEIVTVIFKYLMCFSLVFYNAEGYFAFQKCVSWYSKCPSLSLL